MRIAGPAGRKLQAGTVKLLIKPNRKVHRRLQRKGKAKVRIRLKYTPRRGAPTVQARNLKLKLQ
jgi:hypothetical protein